MTINKKNTAKSSQKSAAARANVAQLWYPKTMNKAITAFVNSAKLRTTLLLTLSLLTPVLSSAQDPCVGPPDGYCRMTPAQRQAADRRRQRRMRRTRQSTEQERREACQDYAYYCVETERWSEHRCRNMLSACTDGW